MANLIIIAAIGMNYELGKENKLIWNISEDMKFFKEKTTGHYIIMGRKTYEAIPSNLANRKYIVLSKNNILVKDNVLKFSDIDTLLKYTKNINDDMYVIGGAQIYKLFLNYFRLWPYFGTPIAYYIKQMRNLGRFPSGTKTEHEYQW